MHFSRQFTIEQEPRTIESSCTICTHCARSVRTTERVERARPTFREPRNPTVHPVGSSTHFYRCVWLSFAQPLASCRADWHSIYILFVAVHNCVYIWCRCAVPQRYNRDSDAQIMFSHWGRMRALIIIGSLEGFMLMPGWTLQLTRFARCGTSFRIWCGILLTLYIMLLPLRIYSYIMLLHLRPIYRCYAVSARPRKCEILFADWDESEISAKVCNPVQPLWCALKKCK